MYWVNEWRKAIEGLWGIPARIVHLSVENTIAVLDDTGTELSDIWIEQLDRSTLSLQRFYCIGFRILSFCRISADSVLVEGRLLHETVDRASISNSKIPSSISRRASEASEVYANSLCRPITPNYGRRNSKYDRRDYNLGSFEPS